MIQWEGTLSHMNYCSNIADLYYEIIFIAYYGVVCIFRMHFISFKWSKNTVKVIKTIEKGLQCKARNGYELKNVPILLTETWNSKHEFNA